MSLSLADHKSMLRGFLDAGYHPATAPVNPNNPVKVEWRLVDGNLARFRLWAFDITHGGGGASVRAADEFRIQITNGPSKLAAFDSDGITDLLLGYSRDRDAIVAYDRRWLEIWTKKKQETGSGGSPSVQVKEEEIQAGHNEGIHHLTKSAGFGTASIVTMHPTMLPSFLLHHAAILGGTMTAQQAQSSTPIAGAASVVDHCANNGFPFDADLVARYVACLLAKPFVIFAGVSGTGKSKLAELVAEYYTSEAVQGRTGWQSAVSDTFVFMPGRGKPDRDRFALIAVRPDWIDNQSILGFVNPITDHYESTQALDLILKANQALQKETNKSISPRYFMLLDEMNLARVEHYFSDWLACVESRRYREDGSVSQQPVPLHRAGKAMDTKVPLSDGTIATLTVPSYLELPTNLVVTGTVNVDETTHSFSPKVLDRAMVLEFDDVDLEQLRSKTVKTTSQGYRFPEILPPFRLASAGDYSSVPLTIHHHLKIINAVLEEARLHIGYRAANEIALFMRIYNDILPLNPADNDWLRALDAAVLQKILPRLSGNRAKLEIPLSKLCTYLRDLSLSEQDYLAAQFSSTGSSLLPKSYRRCVTMLDDLRSFGFVSFFR